MKRIDTYTSILLFFIACQCAFAQTWPPETFTWYYTDSVVTPELKAKAKSGDPTALNDYAFSFWWSERTADEAVAKSRKWMKLAAKAGAPRAMLYYAAWQADNKKSSGSLKSPLIKYITLMMQTSFVKPLNTCEDRSCISPNLMWGIWKGFMLGRQN